jgi:hypothetical protein
VIGAVRRYECVNDVVKAIRCFGWGYVYWDEWEFVVAEVGDNAHGELLGVFTNHGRKGVGMMVLLGTKLCLRCHQRKAVKGGKQSSDGRKFICAECKR